jgi:hypothetical protein
MGTLELLLLTVLLLIVATIGYLHNQRRQGSRASANPTLHEDVDYDRHHGTFQPDKPTAQPDARIETKSRLLNREALIFSSIYVWLSWINLEAKVYATPAWLDGTLIRNHNLLLNFSYTNNEQSRLLQYYVPELFHRLLPLSIEYCYMLQRWLFVSLAFICFHIYLRKWFNAQVTFCGVLLLAAIMPLTYYGNDLQESAPLLLFTFLLGLWAIRENRKIPMIVIFLIGGINNETMLALPLVYFLYNYEARGVRHLVILCRNTLLVSLPMVIAVGIIRYITWDRPHLGGAWHLPDNLEGIFNLNVQYWGILFIFGVLWVYAFLQYQKKPLFLKRASLMIPFFIEVHLVTGIISEIRQMLPLSFVIIPMALFYIYPYLAEKPGSST